MQSMEQLISRISRKIAHGPEDDKWILKFDLDYAYGQLLLSREARYFRFMKRFYGLADTPTIIQEKTDQTLENKHSAWLDYKIVDTKTLKKIPQRKN